MNTIGKRLQHYRTRKELSIREVAKKINVSPSTYRSWELGVSISGEPYMAMCELYNVGLYELLTGEKSDILDQVKVIEDAIKKIKMNI